MKKIITTSLALSTLLFGAGYQIPNNSVNSIALATANVANANGADATYYNPANMVHNELVDELEIAVTYVDLTSVNYKSADGNFDINSKPSNAFIPSINYVSNKLNDNGLRVGFSIISPAGLSREWEDMPATATAKKFALQTIELNPTVAMPINEQFSVGLGLRYMQASAEAELDYPGGYTLSMEGDDSSSFGYNIALSYEHSSALNISATYRSQINLLLEGHSDATLGATPISSAGSIEVPVPANFILAAAYTFDTQTTVEVTIDRTMWSAVQETNFEFDNATLEAVLGVASAKKWKDVNVYRIGLTQKYDKATAMFGFGYSINPAPDQYVSYSSPESDSITISLGGRYDISDTMDIGFAALYSGGFSRTLAQGTASGVNGEISNKDVYTTILGAGFKF